MNRYRALFVSDCHLGSRRSRSDRLIDFLRASSAERLYLVGDVFEGVGERALAAARDVLQHARNFDSILIAPGNHDPWVRRFRGEYGRLTVLESDVVHDTARGLRLLVKHGDCYDWIARRARWTSLVGSAVEDAAYYLGGAVERATGSSVVSDVRGALNRALSAAATSGRLHEMISRDCRERGVDGVVTGHFHLPGIRDVGRYLHADCGDWVDSCTAMAEGECGQLRMVA